MKTAESPIIFGTGHRFLFIGSLMLGTIFVYFFYDKAPGISVPIFAVLLYIAFNRFNRFNRMTRSSIRKQYFTNLCLFLPAGLLAITYALYANPMFRVLNCGAIILLAGAYTVVAAGKSRYRWYELRFARDVLYRLVPAALRSMPVPFRLIAHMIGSGNKNGTPAEQDEAIKRQDSLKSTLKRIGAGVLLSFLPLLVVIVLLASADMMFAELLNGISEQFSKWNIGDTAGRLFMLFIVTIYLFCYGWGLSVSFEDDNKGGTEAGPVKAVKRFDPVVTGTFLLMLNVVYVCFAAIQFSYFFAAGDGALPTGTSYAEYARRGFAELVVVTIINLSIVLVVMKWFNREAGGRHIVTRLLLTLIVGATGVMLVSAFLRLSMYEQAYGFTTTRFLVHAFMIYLAILFAVALIQIWRSKGSIVQMYLVLSIAAYVAVNYINVDKMVAEYNIDRYEDSGKIDMYYLYSLSYDAVPALIKLYRNDDRPADLVFLLKDKSSILQNQQPDWTSWNASVMRAKRLLNSESFEVNVHNHEPRER